MTLARRAGSLLLGLALSLGALAGTALAETYSATYAAAVPATIPAGAVATISTMLTNTGSAAWNASGATPVRLSYHWRRADGSMLLWDGLRTSLPADVAPGAQVTVAAQVRAPDVAASYVLELALVKEGVVWFPPSQGHPVRATGAYEVSFGAVSLPRLLTGSIATVEVPLTNVGSAIWPAGGVDPVRLSYHWQDAQGRLVVWDGLRTSLGSDLAPGASRTLAAAVRAPSSAGDYALTFEMVREGVAWFGPALRRDARVEDATFSATYTGVPASASGFTSEERTVRLTVTNTGDAAWDADGPQPIRLAYHWTDAQGAVVVWDGKRTPLGADVAPRSSRTVDLAILTPARAGSYILRIDLVQEGVAWFSTRGVAPATMTWQLTVGYGARYGPTTMVASAISGAEVPVEVMLENTGPRPWLAGGSMPVRLSYHVFDAAGRTIVWDGTRGALPADVPAGGRVTVPIVVRVPTSPGTYAIGWDLVVEGVAWFSGLGVPMERQTFVVAAGVTFFGRGWGHGVGMSQWGAQGWAQGASGPRLTGEQIVARYYPGTSLSPISPQLATFRVLLSSPSDACVARTITAFSQQRSPGGMRVWNQGTGATILMAAPNQTARVWLEGGVLRVMDEWSAQQVFAGIGPIRITPLDASKPITVDQKGPRAYRGELRFEIESADRLRVVNLVGADDYARGGVPSEMPTGFGWEYEAFKAQAYATKTYAAHRALGRTGQPYDVRDDTQDQCYGGASKETALTDQAVAATAGRIITYDGQPIRALYHSSDGGVTERNGCVFDLDRAGTTYVCGPSQPYLQVVQDPADLAAFDSRGPNPHRSWSQSFTAAQIVDAVRQRSGADIGSFVAVDLSNQGASGRVVSVRVRGTSATVEMIASDFLRFTLGLKSTLVRTTPF